jgi:hypothetical protein
LAVDFAWIGNFFRRIAFGGSDDFAIRIMRVEKEGPVAQNASITLQSIEHEIFPWPATLLPGQSANLIPCIF